MPQKIDINCDMGESFGVYSLGDDEHVMQHITSSNIACGFHAGDPAVMRKTVALAVKYGVNVGAHGGYPDLSGFGRRYMDLSYAQLRDDMVYQMGALCAFARALGTAVRHFKTHGVIDGIAATNPVVAKALADAVAEVDSSMIFIAPNRGMEEAAMAARLRIAHEVYADRAYMPDGTLVPRTMPGAVIVDERAIAQRVARMVREGVVTAHDGTEIAVRADTICLHGDTPGAAEFARTIRQSLVDAGIEVVPLDRIV